MVNSTKILALSSIVLLLLVVYTSTAEAQGGKKACPPDQKITTVMTLSSRFLKKVTMWCIGTDNPMNPGDSAFIAIEWEMLVKNKMSFWIHRCGFDGADAPADNIIKDRKDPRKKVVTENISGDKSKVVRYEFDVPNKILTVKSFKDGKLIDTKTVEPDEGELQDVPHPGSDLEFDTDDDIDLLGGHDFECSALPELVGGKIIPIETTSLLLAAAQSPAWLTFISISALGIGVFVFTRNPCNLRNIKAILRYYFDRF